MNDPELIFASIILYLCNSREVHRVFFKIILIWFIEVISFANISGAGCWKSYLTHCLVSYSRPRLRNAVAGVKLRPGSILKLKRLHNLES